MHRNNLTAQKFPWWKGEENKYPSRTIPDRTMSMKELVERYTVPNQELYQVDRELEEKYGDFSKMSKIELSEVALRVKNEHKARLKQLEATLREKKEQEIQLQKQQQDELEKKILELTKEKVVGKE